MEALLSHSGWLRGLARALCSDEAEADELVQETLWTALTTSRPVQNLRGFLGGVLRRTHSASRREGARRRRREAVYAAERGDEEAPPELEAEKLDTWILVMEEMRALPRSYRELLTQRYLEQRTPTEIAKDSNVAPSTVRAQLSRALAQLRERLDRRTGDRREWLAALAPFSLELATPAASGTGVAIGANLMFWKIGLAGLAALALWWSLDTFRVPPVESSAGVSPEVQESPELLADAEPVVDRQAVDGDRPDGGRAPVAQEAPKVVVGHVETYRGRVLDELTGEPVSGLRLHVRTEAFDGDPTIETHRGAPGVESTALTRSVSFADARGKDEVLSDAEGRFEFSLDARHERAVFLADDNHGHAATTQLDLALPLQGPLRVSVGPTFYFDPTTLPGPGVEGLRATFHTGTAANPSEFLTNVRAGELPWVRFSPEVTRLESDEPWTVEVSKGDGTWKGWARVSRKIGVEPIPLVLESELRGAIEFRAPFAEGEPVPVGVIVLQGPDGARHEAYLDPALNRSHCEARAHQLVPGEYTWSRLGQEGEVDVVAGEVAHVTLEPLDAEARFDIEIPIDTSSLEEVPNLAGNVFRILHSDELFAGFLHRATQVEETGEWVLRLRGLPLGEWTVLPPAGLTRHLWSPASLAIHPGETPTPFTVREKGAQLTVKLRAVDAETGAPIQDCDVALSVQRVFMILETDENGETREVEAVANAESEVIARASGYRAEHLVFTPSLDGGTHTLSLTRGWRNSVNVMESPSLEPVVGVRVLVDGAFAGRTDERGRLWIEGTRAPGTVELDGVEEDYEVLRTPRVDEEGRLVDQLMGFNFMVSRR